MTQPATIIRVLVPPEAQDLLFCPFELAHLETGGRPLVEHGIRFIYQHPDAPAKPIPKPTGPVLRVLAVFSVPTDANPLNLRRERHELRKLLLRIARTHGVAIEPRSLGVHSNTLHKYLKQGRLPSCEFLGALVQAGGDVHWLLGGEGTPVADQNEERQARIDRSLQQFSRSALMAEVDRRLREALDDGTAALKKLQDCDLKPLAKKMRSAKSPADLSDDDVALVRQVSAAFWSLDGMMWWFPDLDPTLHEPFEAFTRLHNKVTGAPAFRTIQYAETMQRVLSRSTP